MTTEECDAAEAYKQEYLRAQKEDIVIVKSPVGMPGRAIQNAFLEKVAAGERFMTDADIALRPAIRRQHRIASPER